jgi:hypothetical protein
MTKEALKLALDTFERMNHEDSIFVGEFDKEIIAIKEALAQPAQEPVAWIEKDMQCDDFDPDSVTCEKPARAADGWEWIPLYTTPAQRPWVGLTDDEIQELRKNFATLPAIAAIEAKLKEKNNG